MLRTDVKKEICSFEKKKRKICIKIYIKCIIIRFVCHNFVCHNFLFEQVSFFFTKERIASNVKISQSVSSHRES